MQNPTIFLTESDAALRHEFKQQMPTCSIHVISSHSSAAALLSFHRTNKPDCIILSACRDEQGEVLELAHEIRRVDPQVLLILLAEDSSEQLAIAALRAGFSDYFRKPRELSQAVASIASRLRRHRDESSGSADPPPATSLVNGDRLIACSTAMQEVRSYLASVAATDSVVLITGETGTGKELVAELIHKNSSRGKKPLVCLNCAAMPDTLLESELFGYERGAFTGAVARQRGKFEIANGGTIFLDEIGDMSLYAQAKILRALESREVYRLGGHRSIGLNVRIIAATNQDPEHLIKARKFRNDLYYRLNVARIHLPPLRERREDIPLLLDHYVKQCNHASGQLVDGFSDEALGYLLRYDWPGNVRELKNLCEATFISQPPREISLPNLPEPYQRKLAQMANLPHSERERLLSALFSTNWNVSKAAQKLQWSRMTVYRKIEQYHISRPESD